MFRDRAEAGRLLAARLLHLRQTGPVVFGLPRGGVVVAAEIARALNAPLDVLVVRKLGAPGHGELAIGAVAEGEGEQPEQTLNHDLIEVIGVSDDYLAEEIERQLLEVRRRNEAYRKGREALDVKGRSVIIVDDGIATGATVLAGILGMRHREPSHIVLAVPVAAPDSLNRLAVHVDEAASLLIPDRFLAVGLYYQCFTQTTDEEVVHLLDQFQQVKTNH